MEGIYLAREASLLSVACYRPICLSIADSILQVDV